MGEAGWPDVRCVATTLRTRCMTAFVRPCAHAGPAEVVHARDQRDALVEDAEADAAGDLGVDLARGAGASRFFGRVIEIDFLGFLALLFFFIIVP